MIPAILALAALSIVAFTGGPMAANHDQVAKRSCTKSYS